MPDYGCRSMTDPLRRVLVRRPERRGLRAVGGVRLESGARSDRAAAGARALLLGSRGGRCGDRARRAAGRRPGRDLHVRPRARDGERRRPHATGKGRTAPGAEQGRPGPRSGRRPRRRHGAGAGRGRGRRLHPPRRANPARGSRLPDERGGHRRRLATAARCRDARLRPSLLAWRERGHAPALAAHHRWTPISSSPIRRCFPWRSRSCWTNAASRSFRCRTRSSRAWARTCSLSPPASRSRSTAARSRARDSTAAGVEVLVYEGNELSLKGDGGPTCLTMPLLRD